MNFCQWALVVAWSISVISCELGEPQTLKKRLSFSFSAGTNAQKAELPVLLVMPSVEINVGCVKLQCRVWEGAIVLTWLPSRDTRAACLQMCQSREKYWVTYELWMQVQNIEYEAMMIYDVMHFYLTSRNFLKYQILIFSSDKIQQGIFISKRFNYLVWITGVREILYAQARHCSIFYCLRYR